MNFKILKVFLYIFGSFIMRLKQRDLEKKISLSKYHEIEKSAFDYIEFKI